MTEHRKHGPINIPIESDEEVFEIDADSEEFDGDFDTLDPVDFDVDADAFEFDTASDGDSNQEDADSLTAPELAIDDPLDEAIIAGAAQGVSPERSTAPLHQLPSLDDIDPYIEPESEPTQESDQPPVEESEESPDFDDVDTVETVEAHVAAPVVPPTTPPPVGGAQAKPGEIAREAVFEMMQELRQKSEQIARLSDDKSDLMDRLLRKQAEFENFRKRGEREMQEAYVRARADIVSDLLPAIDNFDLALQHAENANADVFHEGIQLIYRQLMDTLGRLGLEPIEADGQPFDPEFHEAVATEPNEEVPDHTVVGVLQRGFKLGDRLLRPARVRVAVQP